MEWIEAKIEFEADTTVVAEELLAEVFYAFGVKGVVVEDPETEAPPEALMDEDARPPTNSVGGYFPASAFNQERRRAFEHAVTAQAERLAMRYRVLYRSLAEEDWAESWKAFFWPEKVSAHFVVKPTWRDYTAQTGEIVIDIDPGMAFGTGAHPSTALCLGLMERLLRPGDRFLDVGTGSGILMVAADRLGAAVLHGVDNDPLAVAIARDNLKRNAVDAARWKVWAGDLAQDVAATYSFVAANIYAAVIMNLLDHLGTVMAPEGRFVCSGIVSDQEDMVQEALTVHGFEILAREERESWVALAAYYSGRR
jgi:ribosomal protein L11 methyltransferase